MSYLELDTVKNTRIRKSFRIKEYNKSKFNVIVVKSLNNLLQDFNNANCYKKKIILFNKIFDVVLDNFDIIVQQPNNRIGFLFTMFKKSFEVKCFLEKEIENGEKIHKIYKKYSKKFYCFETTYINYIFQNLIKPPTQTSNDCPICLENIDKKDIIVTDCSHCFHKKCLFKHLFRVENCPICRTNIIF